MSAENSNSNASAPYDITWEGAYVLVKLKGKADADGAKAFGHDLSRFMKAPIRDVILDCTGLNDITYVWVRHLVQLSKQLKLVNKQMRLVSVPDGIALFLRQQGVDAVLRVSPDLAEAIRELML